MSNADLLVKIDALSEDLRKQVLDFIDFLLSKGKKPEQQEKRRPIGLMKDQIHMADDFDEPLEDMRPYME